MLLKSLNILICFVYSNSFVSINNRDTKTSYNITSLKLKMMKRFTSPDQVLNFWFHFGNSDIANITDETKRSLNCNLDYIKANMKYWFYRSSSEFEQIQIDNKDILTPESVAIIEKEWTGKNG
jgi:hypothetical protein